VRYRSSPESIAPVKMPPGLVIKLPKVKAVGFAFGGQKKPAAAMMRHDAWLRQHFPSIVSAPFAKRHNDLWEWFEGLQPGLTPPPRVEVWPRGGAKSSTGELGIAFVGSRLARKFCLYVCETQDQADKHVQTVAGLLERLNYGPAINRRGHSKGWRRDQLRASNGFNLAGIGLDVAARGVKLDEFRPDIIVFDDIDSRRDTPATTGKKEVAITQSLLPAGSSDCVILFLQNLIIDDGIVARIVHRRADYLLDADIVGPIPAVENLQVEDSTLPNGRTYKRIIGGTPTWAGQSLETCQRQIIQWGWSAFRREAQHEVSGANGFFYDHTRLQYVDAIPPGVKLRLVRAWDLDATQNGGDWTVGVLVGAAENGQIYVLDVVRHQFEPRGVRELILRTARRDAQFKVYGPDDIDDRGYFRAGGAERFSFAHAAKGTAKTHLPEDPAQAGSFQVVALKEMLAGFDVVSKPVTGKKATRGENAAELVNESNVFLVRGEWNWPFSEELRQFRADEDHFYDDQADAFADAVNEIRVTKRRGTPLRANAQSFL